MGDSSKKCICFNCKDSCNTLLMNGWKDSAGHFVQLCFNCSFKDSCDMQLINGRKDSVGHYVKLCFNCSSIYKAGQFCEMFHSDEDGWRDCASCKQLIHCGCIVSLSDYMINDSGGITCNGCSDTSLLARDCSNGESHSTDVTNLASDEEPKFVLTPLFEKVVTASDAWLKTSRLRIPKEYALAHFPAISDHQTVPLNFQDTDGKGWDVSFRCSLYGNKRTYFVTGLKIFYLSKKLQADDTVAFYRRESDGKMILELRKHSA